jgi:N6-adenosine-specific RNA methylase IME4
MEETNQNKRYGTLLIDPPLDAHQTGSRGAVKHYKLMTLAEIQKLPITSLAAENAHCWLWTTNAALRDSYDVLEAWGFQARSILTWCKPRIGLGNTLRNATEHLLFATRGNAPVGFKGQPTWEFMPLQDHSHKPEEQYAIIERISQPPYLELFARRRQPGWDVWGDSDKVESDVVVDGYPVPKLSPKGVAFAKNARLSGSDKGKSEGSGASVSADKDASAGGKDV